MVKLTDLSFNKKYFPTFIALPFTLRLTAVVAALVMFVVVVTNAVLDAFSYKEDESWDHRFLIEVDCSLVIKHNSKLNGVQTIRKSQVF
jgi:hypothetical protein